MTKNKKSKPSNIKRIQLGPDKKTTFDKEDGLEDIKRTKAILDEYLRTHRH